MRCLFAWHWRAPRSPLHTHAEMGHKLLNFIQLSTFNDIITLVRAGVASSSSQMRRGVHHYRVCRTPRVFQGTIHAIITTTTTMMMIIVSLYCCLLSQDYDYYLRRLCLTHPPLPSSSQGWDKPEIMSTSKLLRLPALWPWWNFIVFWQHQHCVLLLFTWSLWLASRSDSWLFIAATAIMAIIARSSSQNGV